MKQRLQSTLAIKPRLRSPSRWVAQFWLPVILSTLALTACSRAVSADIPTASENQGTTTAEDNPTGSNPFPTPVDETEAALAYAQCIRANGYPEFPDPNADGQFMMRRDQGMSFDDPQYRAAQEACQELRPPGMGGDMDDEERMEMLLAFSRCMRDNGVEEFPDPDPGGRGFLFTGTPPFNPYSSTFQAALQTCQSHIQGGIMMGGNR
jgi:hypothetical protein